MAFSENLRWLIAHRQVSPKEVATVIDVKVNTISNYINGVSTPNYDLLAKIVKFLDVKADDLLYSDLPVTGLKIKTAPKAAPIIAPNPKNYELSHVFTPPQIITVDRENRELAQLVPAKAAAGYLNGYADPEYITSLPTIDLPGLNGQSHRAFEIRGNSMIPTHHSGSIAIGRFVESFADIRDRRVYIVVTRSDGIVLKRVINRIKQDNALVLLSDNDNKKDYPTYIVSPEDVVEMWYWRASIIRESPEPGNIYNRINDIDGRLAMVENRLKSK